MVNCHLIYSRNQVLSLIHTQSISLKHTHTHTLTHSHTHTNTHTHTRSHTHTLTHSHKHTASGLLFSVKTKHFILVKVCHWFNKLSLSLSVRLCQCLSPVHLHLISAIFREIYSHYIHCTICSFQEQFLTSWCTVTHFSVNTLCAVWLTSLC